MFAVIFTLFALISTAEAFVATAPTKAATRLFAEKSKAIPFLEAPTALSGLIGYKGFDPVGFSNFLPAKFLAEAEIKHGRIAMLGFLGFVATEFIKLPGDVHNFSPVEAHNAAVSSGAMFQILVAVSAIEAVSVVAVKDMLEGSDRKPGEFGFDPLGFSKGDQAAKDTMALKEIENGRLAMVAFGGVVTQAVLSGKSFPYF